MNENEKEEIYGRVLYEISSQYWATGVAWNGISDETRKKWKDLANDFVEYILLEKSQNVRKKCRPPRGGVD